MDDKHPLTDENARPWEPLNGPVHVGDEVRHDCDGFTIYTAVVARVDEDGDPWTAEGGFIGILPDGTWYVRRDGEHPDGTPRFVKVQEGEK